MAATNKFKNWMAAKLGAVLRREITPDEITLGPVFQATGTKTSMIEIEYDGEKYPVVYDKYPIADLFAGGTAPAAIAGEITSISQALPLLNARYGLELKESDVLPGSFNAATPSIAFDMSPTCYEYTGRLMVPFIWTGPAVLPKPLHEWLLLKDTKNTGESSAALTGPITFTTNAEGEWAQLGTLGHIPFPAEAVLSRPGDYTLDFEIMVSVVPNYMCLFTTSASVAGATGSIWWYGGTCYEYGVSSGTINLPRVQANVPMRVTLVRKAGKTSMYLNEVFAQEYNGANNSPLIGFHDGDSANYQFPTSGCLRKIRFWQKALDGIELQVLFSDPPLHYFPLNNSLANYGASNTQLADNFNFVEYLGKTWATPKLAAGAPLGIDLVVKKDFTIDFEIVANSIGDVTGNLFSNAPGAYIGSLGALATVRRLSDTSENQPVMAAMGYSSVTDIKTPRLLSDIPQRITIRKEGTKYSWYSNKVLVWEYTTAAVAGIDWTVFGGTPARSKLYLRELSYFNRAISASELALLFS